MAVTVGQNYFLDFDVAWFNEQYESDTATYQYPDEPYSYYLDDVAEKLGLGLGQDFDNSRVKIQYVSGNESIIDAVKGNNEHVLLYDLDNNVWKHRYVVMVRPLTERGIELIEKLLADLPSTPAFMEIDEDVKLIGEIQENVEDCLTCRKGK